MASPGASGQPIDDDAILLRRIIPGWITWEDGSPRPSSQAFKDRNEHKLSLVISAECSTRILLRGRPEDSIVSFQAGFARSLGLQVIRDPDPNLPGHVVIDPAPKSSKTARRLATKSEWVVFRNPQSRWFRIKRRVRQLFQRNVTSPPPPSV